MNVREIVKGCSIMALECSFLAGLGYLCARTFTVINPAAAAAVSAVSALINLTAIPIFCIVPSELGLNKLSEFFASAVIITSSFASVGITKALGFSISLPSFLYLNLIMVPALAALCLIGVAATIGGFVLKDAFFSSNS